MKYTGPLPSYAGHELMCGRLRAPVPKELLFAECDKSGHDFGDECRYGTLVTVTTVVLVKVIVNRDPGDEG